MSEIVGQFQRHDAAYRSAMQEAALRVWAKDADAIATLIKEGWTPPALEPRHGATGTEARVCEFIAQRQAKGIAKYKTTVEANPLPLRDWLQHAMEESLDQSIYLKRAIEEMERAADDDR